MSDEKNRVHGGETQTGGTPFNGCCEQMGSVCGPGMDERMAPFISKVKQEFFSTFPEMREKFEGCSPDKMGDCFSAMQKKFSSCCAPDGPDSISKDAIDIDEYLDEYWPSSIWEWQDNN